MLKHMHLFQDMCIHCTYDDRFSSQEYIVNKYVYTELLIYSVTPNTISIPLVSYRHTHTHTHTYIIYLYNIQWDMLQQMNATINSFY
jgi:hypothetical protein